MRFNTGFWAKLAAILKDGRIPELRIPGLIPGEFYEGGSLLWKIGGFFVSCRLPRVSRENKGNRILSGVLMNR